MSADLASIGAGYRAQIDALYQRVAAADRNAFPDMLAPGAKASLNGLEMSAEEYQKFWSFVTEWKVRSIIGDVLIPFDRLVSIGVDHSFLHIIVNSLLTAGWD
jgi:hypothetical protein